MRSRMHRSAQGAAGGWCGPAVATPVGTAGPTPAAREPSRDASAAAVSGTGRCLSRARGLADRRRLRSLYCVAAQQRRPGSAEGQRRQLGQGSKPFAARRRFRDRADPEGAAGTCGCGRAARAAGYERGAADLLDRPLQQHRAEKLPGGCCPVSARSGAAHATGTTTNTFLYPATVRCRTVDRGRESSGGNAGNWAVQAWVVCATVTP